MLSIGVDEMLGLRWSSHVGTVYVDGQHFNVSLKFMSFFILTLTDFANYSILSS